jgi:hypothetical protein
MELWMKRLLGLSVVFALGVGGQAWAACAMTPGVADANSQTFTDGPIVGVPGTLTCSIVSDVEVPTGYYGVFKADARGNAHLEDTTDSATLSVNAFSKTGSASVTGIADDDVGFTTYYATGLTGSPTAFTGTATVTTTISTGSDPSGLVSLDSVDLLMGYTTLAHQEDSLVTIGLQQLAVSTHLDETAGLLTGANQPLEGANEFSLIGGYGSYTLGAAARYNLAEGFSLLGGASIVNFSVPGGSASGLLAAGAVRFVQPGSDEMRLMGEAGAQVAGLGLSFSRHYEDGTTAGTDATGSGSGLLGSIYIKGGVLWSPDTDNSVLFSATLKQGALGIGSFIEDDPDTNPNLFAADLSGTSDDFTTVKAGADWTTKLGPSVDLTASLAVGAAYGSGASADVFGVGTVRSGPVSTVFAQYGLRAGWDVAPGSRIDGFLAGSTGTNIGTHAQIGAAYHVSF